MNERRVFLVEVNFLPKGQVALMGKHISGAREVFEGLQNSGRQKSGKDAVMQQYAKQALADFCLSQGVVNALMSVSTVYEALYQLIS